MRRILVENWQNGRATIHGNFDLLNAGPWPPKYIYFKGLEIVGAYRGYIEGDAAGFELGTGNFGFYSDYARGVKVLNCVVHDETGGGIYSWSSSLGTEISGNLTYYNGIDDPNTKDSNTGMMQPQNWGISAQTSGGDANIAAYRWTFKNNVVFNNCAGGVRLYGSTRDYATYDGDTMFNNGSISTAGLSVDFVANDYNAMGTVSEDDIFTNLNTYMNGTVGGQVWIDWTDNAMVTNNYCVCEDPNRPFTLGDWNNGFNTCSGNTIFGTVYDTFDYTSGQVIANVPTTGSRVVIQPCPADIGGGVKLEPGRANVIIYNWGGAATVPVNLSLDTGLANGMGYNIYDAQSFYSAAVLSGTYNSASPTVNIPMSGSTMATPLDSNRTAPAHTSSKFGVFVLVPTNKTPVVSADGDQSIIQPDPNATVVVTLTGTASDDGQPAGSSLTHTWSYVSGGGMTPTIGNPSALVTNATFNKAGVYIFQFTASDGSLTSADQMKVTVINPNATAVFHHSLDANYIDANTHIVKDTSGSGDNGVLNSLATPKAYPAQIPGQYNEALHFNGAANGNYVTTPGFALNNSYAISFWFRVQDPNTLANSVSQYIYFFSWHGTPFTNDSINLWMDKPGDLPWPTSVRVSAFDHNDTIPAGGNTCFEIYDGYYIGTDGLAYTDFVPDANLTDPNAKFHWCDDTWHMVTLNVSKANGTRVYMDGNCVATAPTWGGDAMNGMATATNGIVYGGRSDLQTQRFYDGDIDEVWMFNKELTQADITSLYIVNYPVPPVNQPPVVTMPADPNLKITGGTVSASLAATVSDDGLPSGTVTQSWTMVSGPAGGTVTFSAPTALTTNATFNKVGAYIVKCLATDGNLTSDDPNAVKVSPDTMTVTVNQGVLPNTAPVITMPAQPVRAAEPAAAGAGGVSLAATVSDDGQPNPPALVTVTWSVISAPQNGVVTFVNSHAATTSASFVRVGTYMLNLHASDSNLDANATCQVVIAEDPRGDFDGLNNCDGTDFLIWQRNYNHGKAGSGAPIVDANFNDPNYARKNGDANGDGKVDGSDFLIWQQDYVYCH